MVWQTPRFMGLPMFWHVLMNYIFHKSPNSLDMPIV
jgi:hypothetical protein